MRRPEYEKLIAAAQDFVEKFEATGIPDQRYTLSKDAALAWVFLVDALRPFRPEVTADTTPKAGDPDA